jgi:hypothetical protein
VLVSQPKKLCSGGAQYPASGNILRRDETHARPVFVLTPSRFGKIVGEQRQKKIGARESSLGGNA